MRRGLAATRAHAADVIAAGRVTVGGAPALSAGRRVSGAEAVVVAGPPARFVSRGGDKLDAALDHLGVDVVGRRALDAGASTGGFTDCLLQRGAAPVVAVDVGRAQLHERLRADPRVTVLERTNVRHLEPGVLPGAERVELTVADLSFISLVTVAPALAGLTVPGEPLVLLVKPQFEAGPRRVGRSGVIRDRAVHRAVLGEVVDALASRGIGVLAVTPSVVRGTRGNIEFFALARASAPPLSPRALDDAVAAAHGS